MDYTNMISFVHTVFLSLRSQIKSYLFTGPLLLPLRILLILLSLLLSYLLALLASLCQPPEDQPLTSWRSSLRGAVFLIFRSEN